VNESIALFRISVSDTNTIAPPAKASPKASSRGLGRRENSTIRLPKPVARPAASVTPSATQTFSAEISSMRYSVLGEVQRAPVGFTGAR
jgi:hypothetical protein